jgi:hypothetical protein
LCTHTSFFFFTLLGFEFRALCFLGRCSITWTTFPALFTLDFFFWIGPHIYTWAGLDFSPPIYTFPVVSITWDGVLRTFCLGWFGNLILLISTSWVSWDYKPPRQDGTHLLFDNCLKSSLGQARSKTFYARLTKEWGWQTLAFQFSVISLEIWGDKNISIEASKIMIHVHSLKMKVCDSTQGLGSGTSPWYFS